MLSILVPTYNRAHLLGETISHALAAMAPDDELIIRDNASTDGSPAPLRNIAARDPRIRLELATTNSGPVANWRESLLLARGSHVKLLFSDDVVFPDLSKQFRERFVAGRHQVGLTSCWVLPVYLRRIQRRAPYLSSAAT